jgi:hypothetical protein
MCKEMSVILVNKVVDKKRIIRKNGAPTRDSKGPSPPPKKKNIYNILNLVKNNLPIYVAQLITWIMLDSDL